MHIDLAIAPCSWGVETAVDPDNPPWPQVLDEAAASPYTALELGPFGYLPADPAVLADLLAARQLQLIAGTIYDDLTPAADTAQLKRLTRDICTLLQRVGPATQQCYLVLIDAVKPERNTTAGHSEKAMRLPPVQWKQMMGNIAMISQIAGEEYGIRAVVHPHAGGYIEFDDETEQLVHDLGSESAGLCLDTGHLYYAGDDPAERLIKYASRLEYLHVKDIDRGSYERALAQQQGFFEACEQGLMCSVGTGCLDYPEIFRALKTTGYSGWATVEQERDRRQTAGVPEDIARSYRYLMQAISQS
jgi:inosose dehydratase